jgi:hypothetical protein
MDRLGLGIDWARRSDNTRAFPANEFNDVADMLKIPPARSFSKTAWRNEARSAGSTFWPSQGPQFPLATRQAFQTGASNGSFIRGRRLAGLWASTGST